jgi:hypothetical protein
MKNLYQLIDTHRDELNNLEPESGHFLRFEQKLKQSNGISTRWIIQIAAGFLLVAAISTSLILSHSSNAFPIPAELKETAYFYNQQSEKLLSEIENNKSMNGSEKQLVMKDIQNFEREYSTILGDLKKFPGDERLIDAFIDYHRTRTEFLENILNQINGTNLIVI